MKKPIIITTVFVLVIVGIGLFFILRDSDNKKSKSPNNEANMHTDSYGNTGEVIKLNSEWYPAEYKKCGDIKEITISKEGLKVPCPKGMIYKITIASETKEEDIDNTDFLYEESAADYSRWDPSLSIYIDLNAYSSPDDLYTWFEKEGPEIKEYPDYYPGCPPGTGSEGCPGTVDAGFYEYSEDREKNILQYVRRGGNTGWNVIESPIKRGDSYDVITIHEDGFIPGEDSFVDVILEGMHY